MRYHLMHRDIPVAEIELDDRGNLTKLIQVFDVSHFPLGTAPKVSTLDYTGLSRWWGNRRIPVSRNDLANARGIVIDEGASTGQLLLSCAGLSLSDCYWIKEPDSELTFADLNFFENGFCYDLGDILVRGTSKDKPALLSPDATSEGNLKKRWKIIHGKRVLLKSGTPPYRYEVYNEVIASSVLSHLGFSYVPYFLVEDGNELYCGCEDFVSYSQDFVTAYMIYQAFDKRNDESAYEYLIRCYETLGIENPREVLNQMLFADFLLGNEDRHLNNFGLIRDAKTLAFLGPAPIFDSGSSLGYDLTDEELQKTRHRPWKPFATQKKRSQLDYIQECPVSLEVLRTLPRAVSACLSSFAKPLPYPRVKAILAFLQKRIEQVYAYYGLSKDGTSVGFGQKQDAILSYIRSIGGKLYHTEELCSALSISRITALRNLHSLVNNGSLRRVGARKNGYWELTE